MTLARVIDKNPNIHCQVIEDKKVPQVKMLYPYTGHGMNVTKGEIMFLLDKTNADWWNVRKVIINIDQFV